MPNVQRPGIAVVLPSFHGPLTVCDVGANVNPKPQHLVEYALMASIFSETILGIKAPRVALLSIGGEEVKGNPLTKQAHEMLKQAPNINFVGNVEGRDMFAGGCEVAICDGFVGNVVLKLTEGLADGLFKTIQHEIEVESPDLASRFDPIVKKIWARHDYSEYGGAPLLGLNGVSMICHGSSDRRAIMNAVRVCADFVRRDLNRIMQARLSEVAAHA
jgi:glycerol-3-phosphate acyltransferase PlsX